MQSRNILTCLISTALLLGGCSDGDNLSGGAIDDPSSGSGGGTGTDNLSGGSSVDLSTGQVGTGSGDGIMNFVQISGSSLAELYSGDTFSEAGSTDDTERVSVLNFYLATTELTRGQWRAMVTLTGSSVSATPWADVDPSNAYIAGDNTTEGHPAYGMSLDTITQLLNDWNSKDYQFDLALPTAAQWELACRGGTQNDNRSQYFWSNTDTPGTYALTRESRSAIGVDLASNRTANGYGLFDTHGNLWEWTNDGKLRGGSWSDNLISAQFGNRLDMDVDVPYLLAGIRLVLTNPTSEN
jgi:formylglycine-generating enzyme required for sulfatase activity